MFLETPLLLVLVLAASLVAVSLGGARLQVRFPRAPVSALLAIAFALAVGITLARSAGPLVRYRAEAAVTGIVFFGLPSVAALLALVLFRRRSLGVRIVLALVAGSVGTVYAMLAALAAACGLFGNCL